MPARHRQDDRDRHRGGRSDPRSRAGASDWSEVHGLFAALWDGFRAQLTREELEPIAEELTRLADEILNLLESHVKSSNTSANEFRLSVTYKIQTQTPQLILNLAFEKARRRWRASSPTLERAREEVSTRNDARRLSRYHRLRQGRNFQLARFPGVAAVVRGMLGVSPAPGGGAVRHGRTPAAVVVAGVLQRGQAIRARADILGN